MTTSSTILIIDDQPASRLVLEGLLAYKGYHLVSVSNGKDALQKTIELLPDLLLLDVMMPGMDGFEVCQKLRADPRIAEIPVIMVTALDDNASRMRGLEVGVDDFITKPINSTELLARVRTLTRLNQLRQFHIRELKAERDRTRAILEALGEAVIVTDMTGKIEYVNPAAVTLTGYSRSELVGRPWDVGQGEGLHKKILETIQAGKTWRGEIQQYHQDKSPYEASFTIAPLATPENDEPVGFVTVSRDITQLKEAERAKNKFVSNVSHELRTPLSVITLLSDNLETLYDTLEDQKRRQMIHNIQKHAQVLENLIDDVLMIARFDSQRIDTDCQLLNLAQLAHDEVDKLLPMAEQKSQHIWVNSSGRVVVSANEGHVRQIIRNLVNNAIKYTPEKGQICCECVILPVSQTTNGYQADWPGVSHLAAGQWVALRVSDNGIGITASHIPHLFERFYRVQAQQAVRGTGLGLSIAHELVTLHGGYIQAASTPGQGSTFAIYLPLAEE